MARSTVPDVHDHTPAEKAPAAKEPHPHATMIGEIVSMLEHIIAMQPQLRGLTPKLEQLKSRLNG